MNRLWVRLALAFGVATVLTVVVVALVANSQVTTDFRRYYMRSQVQSSGLLDRLSAYYGQHGSWDGVASVFAGAGGRGAGGMMGGGGMGMGYGAAGLVLADASGKIVYDAAGDNTQGSLTGEDIKDSEPVVWQGREVGYLTAGTPGQMGMGANAQSAMTGAAQQFLSQLNGSLWQAGALAGLVGLLLGIAIAWALSAPLNRLAAATRKIAEGHFEQRVPVSSVLVSADEVNNLAVAFNDMAGSLQQAEQLRRNMVADIAHELRTPLSVVQGNLQAILDGVYPLDRKEIEAIHSETLMLGRLVGDLHELAQAEAGKLALEPQPVNLAELTSGVVLLFREQAAAKGVRLSVSSGPAAEALPLVFADPNRARQVLYNLLSNALRHTPEGGEVAVDVRLALSAGAGAVEVSVRDTGPGIAAEDLPHVFDRFWRADRSRSRDQGGSGLGLTIARQLAEAQGGRIGVESAPGQGSRFWFSLPLAATSAPTR